MWTNNYEELTVLAHSLSLSIYIYIYIYIYTYKFEKIKYIYIYIIFNFIQTYENLWPHPNRHQAELNRQDVVNQM